MVESGIAAPSSWPVFGVKDLMMQINEAHEAEKYLFIWDKSDQLDTFFKYKGFLIDFQFQVLKTENERQTPADAVEALRDAFIKAARQGSHLCVNLDTTAPDFNTVYTSETGFAPQIAFNRNEWRKEEVHKSVLKEDEHYSQATNRYFMMPEHTMTIRSTAPDEAAVQNVISKIPHIEKFACIIIE